MRGHLPALLLGLVAAAAAQLGCATGPPPAPIRPLVPAVGANASRREQDGLRGPVQRVTTTTSNGGWWIEEYDRAGHLVHEVSSSSETTLVFDKRTGDIW